MKTQLQAYNPAFGMPVNNLKEIPVVNRIIKYNYQREGRLFGTSYDKIHAIAKSEIDNPYNIDLSTVDKKDGVKLRAVVGDKIFTENFFNNPVDVVKKAVKYSHKLMKENSPSEAKLSVVG